MGRTFLIIPCYSDHCEAGAVHFLHTSLLLAEREGASEPPEEQAIRDGQSGADAAHAAPEAA